MKRTLQLRRDPLADLSSEELREVAGATRGPNSCHMTFGWGCPTDPIEQCLTLDSCFQTA